MSVLPVHLPSGQGESVTGPSRDLDSRSGHILLKSVDLLSSAEVFIVSSTSVSSFPDAVSDFLSVLGVSRVFRSALHRCRERQTHQRHGVSRLWRARHQCPRTTGQLLLHTGHTGELRKTSTNILIILFTIDTEYIYNNALNSFNNILSLQLRDCLEPEVYELFHKKLTEHALMKDPKFLWCCHVSS